MKKFSILFFGLLVCSVTYSQNHKLDSLLRISKSLAVDTVQARIFTQIASEFLKTDPSKARAYADSAMAISQSIDDHKGKIISYRLKGISHAYQGNYQDAKHFFRMALVLSIKYQRHKETASAFNQLGNVSLNISQFDSAIYFAHKSIAIDSSDRNTKYVYTTLASAHRLKNEYPVALSYNLKNLDIVRRIGDSDTEVKILQNIGNLYSVNAQFEEAQTFYRQALEKIDTVNSPQDYAIVCMNMGNSSAQLRKFSEAKTYYEKALRIANKQGLKGLEANVSNNMGNILHDQCFFKEALPFYFRALELAEKIGDKRLESLVRLNIGRVYIKLNEVEKAQQQLDKNLKLTVEYGFKDISSKIYQHQHDLDSIQGNYKSALINYKRSKVLQDSIFSIEKSNQMAEIKEKYEAEKKALQIQNLNKEVQAKEALVQKQTYQLYSMIALGGLGTVALMAFYFRNKLKREKKLKQAMLQQHRALIQVQEEVKVKISRELHDNIGQKLVALKLYMENARHQNVPVSEQVPMLLDEVTEEVRTASHLLSPYVLETQGLAAAIDKLLCSSFNNTKVKFSFETFNIRERYSHEIEINVYRVCQELLTNIIKHSQANNVTVQLFENSGYLILIIEDDGVGFQKPLAKGFGLKNIASRLQMLGGKYTLASEQGQTIATVRIPI